MKSKLILCLALVLGTTFLPNLPAQEIAKSNLVATIVRIDHDRILRLANQALQLKPPAITDHIATNSAGGLHDFFSQGDYAWPNPTNKTGLPFIGRDGESNPNVFSYHRMAMRDMKDAVAALAAAYVITGDDKYVRKANELLKVFFLDDKTRMNPNLQYAQAVLGSANGEPYGIIDTLHLAELTVAIPFLEKSPAFDPAVDKGLKQWFNDYTDWILTYTNGVKEMNNPNNHSIACFVQLASFAKFTGDQKVFELSQQRFKETLFPNQMTNNGSFPRELKRTKPFGYSIFQADNLATLCVLLSTTNEDFWKIKLADGRMPKNAVDFIYPYLADKNKWLADGRPKDVMHWDDWPAREPCLIFAYAEFGDEKYFDLWRKLNPDPADLEIRRNMAVTQPLLWIAEPDEIPFGLPSKVFRPGAVWFDDKDVAINAHGGGILFHDGTYYWFGEHKVEGMNGNRAQVGVHVYSSTNLYCWKDEGIALAVSDDPKSEIAKGCILERPKVIFNEKTKKFVMWFHLELIGKGYHAARSGVAIADKATGPYQFLYSLRPNAGVWPENVSKKLRKPLTEEEITALAHLKLPGSPVKGQAFPTNLIFRRDFAGGQMARDMTLFVDDNQKAYQIYSSEENGTIQISELTRDYLKPAGHYIRILPGQFNEAPAMFKHDGKYFLITSGTSGWAPNAARLAMADSILGPWTSLGNPCRGTLEQTNKTFESQSAYILPVSGNKDAYIFVADRWQPKNAIDGRYVWLPVQWDKGIPFLQWQENWNLEFFKKQK